MDYSHSFNPWQHDLKVFKKGKVFKRCKKAQVWFSSLRILSRDFALAAYVRAIQSVSTKSMAVRIRKHESKIGFPSKFYLFVCFLNTMVSLTALVGNKAPKMAKTITIEAVRQKY